jgi:hypothetical protein
MSQTATITIVNPGPGVGPFNLYGLNSGGVVIQTLALNIPLSSLIAPGYIVYGLLNTCTSVKIQSDNVLCDTYVIALLQEPPACNCITFSLPLGEDDETYGYTDCDGDLVENLTITEGTAKQVCGSTPVVSDEKLVSVIVGDRCVDGACVNGTFAVSNCTYRDLLRITNVTPYNFYSFNNPPTFPDSPQVGFPIIGDETGCITESGARVLYNGEIQLTVTYSPSVNALMQFVLTVNGVVLESHTRYVNPNGANTVVYFNTGGLYTFNPTDDVVISVYNGRG